MKLKSLMTIAAAGMMATSLAACGAAVTAEQGGDLATGHVDAAQSIGPYTIAIEFTPKTTPNMQCVGLISRSSYTGNGGVTCWAKTPAVVAPAPAPAG